jgi:hypothetical protein
MEAWRFASVTDLVNYITDRAAGIDHVEAVRRSLWADY